MLRSYVEMLRDPSVPANRVARKSAAIAFGLCGALAYYRHVNLRLPIGEPLLATVGLGLILFFVIGMMGAVMAGSVYHSFLKQVDARNADDVSFTIFFAEWVFAALAPCFGIAGWALLGNTDRF